MSGMSLPRRKYIELAIMFLVSGVFYFFIPKFEELTLFYFGFIWNWSYSVELDPIYDNPRYRFSMLRTVINFQKLILRPFHRAPEAIKRLIGVLPAGIFWWLVIYINESSMPWWTAFVGSICFELVHLRSNFSQDVKNKT
jgi:hypothetical protein